jgi:hypothetical protein
VSKTIVNNIAVFSYLVQNQPEKSSFCRFQSKLSPVCGILFQMEKCAVYMMPYKMKTISRAEPFFITEK